MHLYLLKKNPNIQHISVFIQFANVVSAFREGLKKSGIQIWSKPPKPHKWQKILRKNKIKWFLVNFSRFGENYFFILENAKTLIKILKLTLTQCFLSYNVRLTQCAVGPTQHTMQPTQFMLLPTRCMWGEVGWPPKWKK